MLQSIEAVVDQNGVLRLIDPVEFPRLRRVIITFLDEDLGESMDLEKLQAVELMEKRDDSPLLTQKPSGIIARLLENPIEDPTFSPLTRDEIYDRGL